MIQVTKFYARSFDLDHLDLFWEVVDFYTGQEAGDDIRAYDFYILRSESIAGPWDVLAGPFQDAYYFRDTTPLLMHRWRNLFYKLRIVDKRTQETAEFGPTAQLGEPDLSAMEIIRQEDVLFREFIGRRCWVFPVRTFGPKCLCFDRLSSRRTKSNCLNCFDTGYLGGYMSPIECFIQFDPSPKNNQQTPLGEQQTTNTSARLISFPPLKPKDILVEAENKRWEVVTVATTQRLRAVVHQELTVHQIPLGDVKYKLPINIDDLTALEPSAERNFTNPQHVDDDDLRSILAVYRYCPRGSVR